MSTKRGSKDWPDIFQFWLDGIGGLDEANAFPSVYSAFRRHWLLDVQQPEAAPGHIKPESVQAFRGVMLQP